MVSALGEEALDLLLVGRVHVRVTVEAVLARRRLVLELVLVVLLGFLLCLELLQNKALKEDVAFPALLVVMLLDRLVVVLVLFGN